jgi:hypothetical protein
MGIDPSDLAERQPGPSTSKAVGDTSAIAKNYSAAYPSASNPYMKDMQASACFPRQSARDACQMIMEAIQKCNMYAAKKHRISSALAADNATAPCSRPPVKQRDAETEVHSNAPVLDGCSTEKVAGSEQIHARLHVDYDISLDHILSSVSYKDMLHDLFGGFEDNEVQPSECAAPLKAPCIPVVTKTYEESFMREPMWEYERQCVMGSNCECNFIGAHPGEGFTAVEFTLPSEQYVDSCDRSRQMCVLCHRRLVQSLFYDIIYAGSPYKGVIQRYGNICNHEGEYAREVMLICPPNGPVECMPFPSASHQRNKYAVYSKGGIRYIKQNHMGWQDFCQAPPSSAAP